MVLNKSYDCLLLYKLSKVNKHELKRNTSKLLLFWMSMIDVYKWFYVQQLITICTCASK